MLLLMYCVLWFGVLKNPEALAEITRGQNVTYEEGYFDAYNESAQLRHNDVVLALNLFWKFIYTEYTAKKFPNKHNMGNMYASAAALAIQDVNNDHALLPNHRLRYVWKFNETRTFCNRDKGMNNILKQLKLRHVHGFLGFSCYCTVMASVASAVNMPFFSHMVEGISRVDPISDSSCTDMDLSKKKEYPTFARTTTLNSDVIYMILQLLKKYSWNKFAIIYEKSHIWGSVHDALKNEVEDDKSTTGMEITLTESYYKTDGYIHTHESLAHIFVPFMDKLPRKARVVLLMMDKGNLQEFMLLAAKKNLVNGDYVFIAVHPFAPMETFLRDKSYVRNYVWVLPWTRNPENSEATALLSAPEPILEKAFQSLFILMPQIPKIEGKEHKEFERFQARVRRGMKEEPFCSQEYEGLMQNTVKYKNNTKPPPEAHQLYDAVKLYGYGLNKTIAKGYSVTNGTDIILNILNTEHKSISGSPFIVNCKADVQVLFELAQFQFDGKSWKENGYWLPKRVFLFETRDKWMGNCTEGSSEDRDRFVLKKAEGSVAVKWLTGQPPPDVPKCGFNDEKCPKPESSKGATIGLAISLALLGVIILVIPFFLYRNYLLKKDLVSQPWKILASELFFHDWSVSTSSLGSLTSHGGSLQYEMPTKQQYIPTAYYKGTLVAVKKLDKRSIELNKIVLMELKQVRDIRHENLNTFIGACVEPNNVLIISSYATRGSLQDVLEDNDIQLDAPFILSLVYDIVKGMVHLHSSTDIKSHGNLKSSNCVIDNRWVLKITDFGLNMFRSKQGTLNSIKSEPCNSLLWRAPELLRLNIPSTSRGTQKGDVYSFGIILQECHTRDGAWGSYQDAEAVIERVVKRSNPPFRPVVKDSLDMAEALRDIMKKCWEENPEERPYFSELRKDVERMMKENGMRANLVENMITMLEKHSRNLEELVAARTTLLREEKHKVEALLERMLPKTVAKQLMQGNQVEPNSYEEVTIYFSDIVGFTNICATIEPIDVVTLLNTLYTMFDNIASDYDVYKVETIGDAYMVVSGLPIRNKKQHVKEISLMALDILENMKSFKIRPKNQQLLIRIGVHSGPVVAGVVGTTMPRYCLFGDTVNVAARMESNGEPCRIHLSNNANSVLAEFGGFVTEPRGNIHVKGRGEMETYWLTGVESKLMRKRTMTKRDQHTLYQQKGNSPSFSRLIRESPKIPRNRLHVTQTNDYTLTPPLNPPPSSAKDKRIVNYHSKPLNSCKKPRNNRKAPSLEMGDYNMHSAERHRLLSTVSTIGVETNGNELSIPISV